MSQINLRSATFLQLIVILLLCAVTVGFFNNYERYNVEGENILNNGDFQQGLKNWEKQFSKGSISIEDQVVLRMHSQYNREVMYVRQHIENKSEYSLLLFTGKMRTEGVERGEKHWQTALLVVIGIDAMGLQLWHAPHFLAKQHGTNEWQHFDHVFKLNEDAKELRINIQMPMVKGTVWVKDLSLQPVNEKPAYKIYWIIAIVLWFIAIFWVLIDYLLNYGFNRKQIPIVFLLSGIAISALIPQSIVMLLNDFVLRLSPWVLDAGFLAERTGFVDMDAIWHFMAFVLLALVAYWRTMTPGRLAQSFGLLVLFALVTEVLQLLVDSRKLELMDFIADISGIVVALVLWFALRASKVVLGRMILFPNT